MTRDRLGTIAGFVRVSTTGRPASHRPQGRLLRLRFTNRNATESRCTARVFVDLASHWVVGGRLYRGGHGGEPEPRPGRWPEPGGSPRTHRGRPLLAVRARWRAVAGARWWRPDGLAGLLGEVDALGAACDAARVAVVGEAMDRGETSGGPAAMTTVQWVRHHAPSTKAGGAAQVVAVAQAFGKTLNAPVKHAVDAGRLPVRSAAVVVASTTSCGRCWGTWRTSRRLTTLIDLAVDGGPRRAGRSARSSWPGTAPTGALQDQQDRGKAFISLSQPRDTGADTFEYRLTLDVEGKAVLEAALGPLSAPAPVDGERDLRTIGPAPRRRPAHPGPPRGGRRGRGRQDQQDHPAAHHGLRRPQGRARGRDHGGRARRRHPPRPRDRAAAVLRRLCHPPRPRRPQRGARLGARATVLHPGPDQTAVAARRRVHLPGLRRPATVDRRTPPAPLGRSRPLRPGQRRCPLASGTTRSCTPAATPAASCATSRGNGWSGTSPAAPTTTSSPDGARATPRPNQRDPAPHPTDTGGVIGMSDAAPVRLLSVRLPSVRLPSAACRRCACRRCACGRRACRQDAPGGP